MVCVCECFSVTRFKAAVFADRFDLAIYVDADLVHSVIVDGDPSCLVHGKVFRVTKTANA